MVEASSCSAFQKATWLLTTSAQTGKPTWLTHTIRRRCSRSVRRMFLHFVCLAARSVPQRLAARERASPSPTPASHAPTDDDANDRGVMCLRTFAPVHGGDGGDLETNESRLGGNSIERRPGDVSIAVGLPVETVRCVGQAAVAERPNRCPGSRARTQYAR